MATFQVTFKRGTRETRMTVEAPNQRNATEVAEYFQMAHGQLKSVKAVKA